MAMKPKDLVPYFAIAGQLWILYKLEHQWMQVGLVAFMAFQFWKKYERNQARKAQ